MRQSTDQNNSEYGHFLLSFNKALHSESSSKCCAVEILSDGNCHYLIMETVSEILHVRES